MLKILAFLTKKEGIETQAFIEHYENNHVPLIAAGGYDDGAPGVRPQYHSDYYIA
jgi:hypothetical protein